MTQENTKLCDFSDTNNNDFISNQSVYKIIIVGIDKVTQFSIVLSHRDKQAIQHTSKQEASEKEANGKERANKTARVKWGRGKREANGK